MGAPLAVEMGDGWAEFRKALRDVGAEWPKQLGQANKEAAGIVARQARTESSHGTNQQHAAGSSWRASAAQAYATVMVGGSGAPFAGGAFMGSRNRFGWYADPRYAESTGRQFPPWVGNQWDPGESWDGHASGEPYVIGDAIRASRSEFTAAYEALLKDLADRAFPN